MYKLQTLNSLYSNSKFNRPEDEVWNIWKHKQIAPKGHGHICYFTGNKQWIVTDCGFSVYDDWMHQSVVFIFHILQ